MIVRGRDCEGNQGRMCVRPDEDLKFIAMSGGKWNERYGERTGLSSSAGG